ncbi:6-phosphogluconolactonase [Lewinella marina]|uniref:6-phosphogluconolactonase n=1 Tax=Neolewinella marina TaxID=438751 RepID=A0A2G0CJP4_9BACT|nr:lactonase family protein [Neolewinella marina]NJB84632.1 6-phosphogluconolactonase [Neolewinella marina]PHL00194.1 6-phosphogluconolactonase [Neolewinella marina]
MRLTPLLLLLTLACSTPSQPADDPEDPATTFLLGTYDDPGVHEAGIYRFALHADGGLTNLGRVGEAENPSFLAYNADRSVLVSVEQLSGQPGRVKSFAVGGDSLRALNQQPAGGEGPCHVNVSADGFVTVANYGAGTLELLRLQEDGYLTQPLDLQDHRQRGAETPHAHSSYFLNDGSEVLAVDLGTDEVWQYHLDTASGKLRAADPPAVAMEDGAGPRHLAVHPGGQWVYVINELNSTVTQLNRTAGGLSVVDSWSTLPEDFTGESFCADIHISADGRFLYGSNRGHNSIVVYRIDEQTGGLTPLEYESVAGDWPRNFALSPDGEFLLVANQRSKNITSLRRNKETGMLDFVGTTKAPIPVCILF